MWSTLLFYPADVAKIRLQAEADAHEEEEQKDEGGSSPLGAAAGEGPTAGAEGPKGGPKSFFGEVLVVLKRPDLWYAGLGEFPHLESGPVLSCSCLPLLTMTRGYIYRHRHTQA